MSEKSQARERETAYNAPMLVEAGGYRPNGEQFAEGSANDQAFTVGNPVDLEGNIRTLVEQARAEQGENFNAAWFLRKEMRSLFYTAGQNEPIEKGLFFDDLHIAWGLVAWDELEDYRYTVYSETQTYLSVMQTFGRVREGRMQLSPLGVTLLDAMAEAVGLEHAPGQDTFDLSFFQSTEAIARIESNQNPEPTSEEIKRVITKSVDIEQS
jgi:hypothetical protein